MCQLGKEESFINFDQTGNKTEIIEEGAKHQYSKEHEGLKAENLLQLGVAWA